MSLALNIPRIETERLLLRAPCESDFEAVAAFGASPRAAFVGGTRTRFQSWRGFLAVIGHWALRGYGMWTVQTQADDAPIGRVGLINHDGWPEPELGWQLFDGHEGKGYATEAANAARAHAYSVFGLATLVSYIAPANSASRRVAERLGARPEAEIDLLGDTVLVYRHPTPQELAP